jgi:hypothetical protein
MTQENKELLLKDLCARLPHGVKVLCLRDFNHTCYNLKMVDIEDNEVYLTTDEPYTNRYAEIETIKPYLFPLSSMTEYQEKECQQIKHSYYYDDDSFVLFDWYNKNHFDYRGLIEKGLAIDATGKNIY